MAAVSAVRKMEEEAAGGGSEGAGIEGRGADIDEEV